MFLVPSLFALAFWARLRYSEFFSSYAGEVTDYGIVLLGNYIVYVALALTMSAVALGKSRRSIPEWFITPLPHGTVIGGALWASLLAALIPLVSLLAFVIVTMQMQITEHPQYGELYAMFYPHLLTHLLRLPHFALAAFCLALALRHSVLAQLSPFLLSLAATLILAWDIGTYMVSLPYAPAPIWPALLGVGGILLLLCLMGLLVGAARRRDAFGEQLACLVCFIIIPTLFGLASMLPQVFLTLSMYGLTEIAHGFAFIPLHACYANLFPDVYQFTLDFRGGDVSSRTALLYGYQLPRTAILLVTCGIYLVTLSWWWHTASRCLDAARKPQM